METDGICRNVPISATYRLIDGEPVMIDAEYVDIPADVFARFLLQKFGKDAIFGKNEIQEKKVEV